MTDERRLLLVEDEPSLVFMLTDRLEREGYVVETATDGHDGLARAASVAFDVIVLDGMLPGRDGLDVCRELRQQGVRTPILMLSARSQVADRVVGLRLGADDYLAKPFEVVELLARLDALLRRTAPAAAPSGVDMVRFGDISVSRREALVRRGGHPVELTALEYKLLVYLIRPCGSDPRARRAARCRLGLRRHAVDADRGRARGPPPAEARARGPAAPAHRHDLRPGLQVRRLAQGRGPLLK